MTLHTKENNTQLENTCHTVLPLTGQIASHTSGFQWPLPPQAPLLDMSTGNAVLK